MNRADFILKVLPILKEKGPDIGNAARNGNEKAVKIMELYNILYNKYEPAVAAQLEKELRKLNE